MSTRVWHRMVIAVLSLGFVSLPVKAQSVGPLANTTVGNARLIVPDGSSLRQSISSGETRWFVFSAEPGKTYVVEAVDPDSDLVSNTIGALHVYAANGTTTPPAETNVDCTASTRAPAMELPVAVSGMRCVVRAFPPSPGNTQNKRGLYVAVGLVDGPSFDIRVRESTIYGRWTTNGYDFHVELENTTADAMCAEVIFLPNAGESYSGTWSGGLTTLQLTIPPFGANKTVFANGTLVHADNKGTLRIGACASPTNFVPTALHVSTYAYNPVTDKFLYFFTNAANNGATANSWSGASGAGAANAFVQGGNAFGATAALGTTDTQPLELRVANARGLRIEPPGNSNFATPNIIGGSPANSAAAGISGATIAGGGWSGLPNSVMKDFGTVGGGYGNTASGSESTVAGGYSNTASGYVSTVAGGEGNTASGGFYSTVAGGSGNTASGDYSTVAGGVNSLASGSYSTVAGGYINSASGNRSFAAGSKAKAAGNGSFALADTTNVDFLIGVDNFFGARFTGGFMFATSVNGGGSFLTGCQLAGGGGSWNCTSDRNTKTAFAAINPEEVLRRVASLPITEWQFMAEPEAVRHMGSMAQDFHAAFGLGHDDKTISMLDAQGVALAAIQGLNAKVEEQRREIAELRGRVSATESLRGELAALGAELADLRETRTHITARAPAADVVRADAAR